MPFFPEATEALIFDLDGTLYDQGKLRRKDVSGFGGRTGKKSSVYYKKLRCCMPFGKTANGCRKRAMMSALLKSVNMQRWLKPWDWSIADVRRIVNDWIFEKPLKHLAPCLYPGVRDLFPLLRQKKIKIGIFSDYPCDAKLQALDLKVDVMVCATDEKVDRFKPHPQGLFFTARELGVPVKKCFFIGDRDDKDGECARRAGMPYLILPRRRISILGWYQEARTQISRMDRKMD